MLYVDISFVNNVAVLVRNFKKKPGRVYNFSCPLCGDSQKDRSKARAYLFPDEQNSSLIFKCHNCSRSMAFGKFLKIQFPEIYDSYILEKYKKKGVVDNVWEAADTARASVNKKYKISKENLQNMVQVSELPENHIGRVFCKQRKLPNLGHIYFTDNWSKLAEEYLPGKYQNLPEKDPRIVLVYRDHEGKITGLQGRAILNSKQRYITAAPKNAKMIFGEERMNRTKTVYVLEGPLDSLFLNNAIAVGTSDLLSAETRIGSIENAVYVPDNQPRNKEIVKIMEKIIDRGKKICIWPSFVLQKDINEMILAGYGQKTIKSIIDESTYCDISAKVIFGEWKKC
jgi:hypothetical protein